MNKKASTCAFRGQSIPTIYPTRHPTGSKVGEDVHDRYATGQVTAVAGTRIFHPFEYWMQEPVGTQNVPEDLPADAYPGRAIQCRRFKRPVIVLAWLHDCATRLFHLARGP
jgi:hypothetical protein